MALTVRGLVAQADLGVQLVAGAGAPERPITWVHVSELDDPTPFLSGGELLLTTGLFVRPGTDLAGYVERLCAAGVLGLGFGVGLSHAQVPGELAAAADRKGLALLEVPRRTPFIALSRAVSNALAADEYAAVTRTFTAQQELTRAALAPESPERLIRLLARKIDGWVVLLDGRGAPLALGGDRAATMVPAVAVEAARLREHRGSVGAGFEIDGGDGAVGDTVSLQPVGAGRRRAFLAVGRPGPLPAADRHLVNAAVMLLTLSLEQHSAPDAVRAVRAAVLELALGGHLDLARSIAARVGPGWPDDPLVVLVRQGGGPVPDLGDAAFASELDGELVVLVPAGDAIEVAGLVAGSTSGRSVGSPSGRSVGSPVSPSVGSGSAVGRSAPTDAPRLAQARDQARRAAEAAAAQGVATLGFADLASAGLAGLLEPGSALAFAQSSLASLVEHDRTRRGDLVASLRAWLAHHGQWDPSAAALGVHRHTLRRRMALAGELLGRDLDSPTVRSELWLALEALAGSGRD